VVIYALRLDRGLSTKKALASVPGTYPEEERGLNDERPTSNEKINIQHLFWIK